MQLWPLGVLIYCAILFARVHTLISVRNGRLVDEAGGERIFHGLNLVSKGFPYITSFNEADMKLFQ